MITRTIPLLLATLLGQRALPTAAQGQEIGTTICACSPSVYTFQFNFSYVCNQTNVDGPGVADWDCFSQGLGPGGDGVMDYVPVRISSVDIIELDQSLAPIGSSFYGEGYTNGDIIKYVSVAGNPSNVTSLLPAQIPKAIQLSIVGTNVNEEDITNVWIILFDNLCGFFQVLQTGDQIGWTKLVRALCLWLSVFQVPVSKICSNDSFAFLLSSVWMLLWTMYVRLHPKDRLRSPPRLHPTQILQQLRQQVDLQ